MERVFPEWDQVHTIDDWYDGARAGVADYRRAPYWYRSVFLDSEKWDPDEDRFELTPLTAEVLAWDLERGQIFSRWDSARNAGLVTWTAGDDEAKFGALPDELGRYRELTARLNAYLSETMPERVVRGRFEYQPRRVQWEDLKKE